MKNRKTSPFTKRAQWLCLGIGTLYLLGLFHTPLLSSVHGLSHFLFDQNHEHRENRDRLERMIQAMGSTSEANGVEADFSGFEDFSADHEMLSLLQELLDGARDDGDQVPPQKQRSFDKHFPVVENTLIQSMVDRSLPRPWVARERLGKGIGPKPDLPPPDPNGNI